MKLIPYILVTLALFYLSSLAYILIVALKTGAIASDVILYMLAGLVFGFCAERQYNRMRRKQKP